MAKTPFIILANRRTGSNWLESLLNSHPQVLCFAEIHAEKAHVKTYVQQFRDTFHFRPITTNPSIQSRFFYFWSLRRYNAAGYRLFPRHVTLKQNKRLVPTLRKLKELRTVCLRRENSLRSYVSLQIALNTGVWRFQDAANYREIARRVRIDVPQFLEYCRTTQAETETLEGHFQHRPSLHLTYERLRRDTKTECRRLLEFLGLEPSDLSSQMKAMNPEPLTRLIQNYEEVRAQLSDTPMRWMLDEES